MTKVICSMTREEIVPFSSCFSFVDEKLTSELYMSIRAIASGGGGGGGQLPPKPVGNSFETPKFKSKVTC